MKNLTLLIAIATLTLSVPSFAQAPAKDSKMAMKSKMADKKMAPVYVCKDCKMAYSESDAKKMKMKDGMGHKLTKMSKMPAGFKMMGGKMGDKMMGGDKTGKMGGDKMGGKM